MANRKPIVFDTTNYIYEQLVNTDTLLTGNVDVTGDITLTGTVDGRNLETDGTKLDGIEAGAEVNTVTSVNGQTGAVTVASGSTDLSYTASTRLLESSSGTDVTLPEVVAAGNSGLMTGSDKTKLNSIEANATADQTASEILTAIKTVDGATSGLDSDLLDGQHGAYYLDYGNFTNIPSTDVSADTTPQLGGDLDLNSNDITGTGNIDITGSIAGTSLSTGAAGTGINVSTTTITGPSTMTIDPAVIGNNTGTLVVAGNLQVDGTTTTINSSELTVDDKLITLASGASTAAEANGGGMILDGASASITYSSSNDRWNLNKGVDVTGNITLSGTVDGRDVATDGTKLDGIESGAEVNTVTSVNGQTGAVTVAGSTDLSYTASTRVLASSTGTNATLPEVVAGGDSGLMTGADKTKLNGIETGAEVNTVTSVNGQTGAVTVAGSTDLSYTASTRVLASSTGTNATLPEVVAAGDSGLMTGADKTKLNGIETGAEVNTVTSVNGQTGAVTVSGSTDLSYTASTRVLASSTGTDATLPEVVAAGDSGLMTGADKTKLNGIESNATADQTASEILTAIKTVDGTGSGLDADTVDGIEGSNFLRSDISDTTNGNLTISSGSPQVIFSEVDTSTAARLIVSGGDFYIQSGASGSGTTNSSGDIRFTGYNADNINEFTVRTGGSYNTIWHAGNDGSGSGLDADTIDGVDSLSFLRSDASDVATGPIAWEGTLDTFDPPEDGGSGTDTATDVAIGLGSGHRIAGYVSGYIRTLFEWNNSSDISIGQSGTGLITGINLLPGTSGNAKVNGNTIWHAGNDGSGSGLDADTVDGIEASSFLRSDADDTASGDITFTGSVNAGTVTYSLLNYGPTTSTRDKIRVYPSSSYAIGMQSGISFGGLNNDWGMTFVFNDDADRGYWWGDVGHSTAQGAMALTTNGKLTVAHSLRIGYGESDTTIPGATHRLDVSGSILATNDITAFSDISLKSDIQTIPNALDKILKIRGVTYVRNDLEDKSRKCGVIAQEVEEVLPEVVSTTEDGTKTVAYGNLVGLLIESIKELKTEIETLKKQIEK